jgi:hypothetical protein
MNDAIQALTVVSDRLLWAIALNISNGFYNTDTPHLISVNPLFSRDWIGVRLLFLIEYVLFHPTVEIVHCQNNSRQLLILFR